MSSIIRSVNPSGFLAVNPAGHLVAIPSRLSDEEVAAGARPDLKAGFRWASAEDIALVEKVEADRAAKEAKSAKPAGPLGGA